MYPITASYGGASPACYHSITMRAALNVYQGNQRVSRRGTASGGKPGTSQALESSTHRQSALLELQQPLGRPASGRPAQTLSVHTAIGTFLSPGLGGLKARRAVAVFKAVAANGAPPVAVGVQCAPAHLLNPRFVQAWQVGTICYHGILYAKSTHYEHAPPRHVQTSAHVASTGFQQFAPRKTCLRCLLGCVHRWVQCFSQ